MSEPPFRGRQKGVTPICSHFPVFFPISSDLRSLFSGIPRFVSICSSICSDNISDAFCTSPNFDRICQTHEI